MADNRPRKLDSYCDQCEDFRTLILNPTDPGSAKCSVCGATHLLMKPLSADRTG